MSNYGIKDIVLKELGSSFSKYRDEETSRHDKIEEAKKRMAALKLSAKLIEDFANEGRIVRGVATLNEPVEIDESDKEFIAAFERANNAVVFYVAQRLTSIGKMDSFIFVSDYKDEWIFDNEDVASGYVYTYTVNYMSPEFSEFGAISVVRNGDVLVRIA